MKSIVRGLLGLAVGVGVWCFMPSIAEAALGTANASLSLDKEAIVADGTDIQTARLTVFPTDPVMVDRVSLIINYPQAGEPNQARGYFQWSPSTGFQSVGGAYYGQHMVNLLTSGPQASKRMMNADGSVTYIFSWQANPSYGAIAENDVAYQVMETSTGSVLGWRSINTNFSVTPVVTVSQFRSLTVEKGSVIANGSDAQTARLVLNSRNPDAIDQAAIIVNYPGSSGDLNPYGYFQWTAGRGFESVGGGYYGAEHVTLLPGSARIVDTDAGTVTFVFQWTIKNTATPQTGNSIAYYVSETANSHYLGWRVSEARFDIGAAPVIVPTGTLTIVTAPRTLASRHYAAGSRMVTAGSFVLSAVTEGIQVDELHLTRRPTDAVNSTEADVEMVSITNDRGDVLGTGIPVGGTFRIMFAPGVLRVNPGTDVILHVKANLGDIGPTEAVTVGGHRFGFSIADANDVVTRGVTSGNQTLVTLGASGVATNPHSIYESILDIDRMSLPSSLINGSVGLFKFRVRSTPGGASIHKLTFDVDTAGFQASGDVRDLVLVDVTNPSNEQVLNLPIQRASDGTVEIYMDTDTDGTRDKLLLFGNQTRTLVLRGQVSGSQPDGRVVSRMLGDTQPFVSAGTTPMQDVATVDASPANNTIWSDRHVFTSHTLETPEWTNGFRMSGLASGVSSATILVQ